MENYGKMNLINELTQGKEYANQLRFHISPTSSTGELLIESILSTFDNALSKLNCNAEPRVARLGSPMTESPQSGSPRSDDSDSKDLYKKRKSMPRWTEQVRVTSGSGIEGAQDDGHSWRKYGQKDILGAKYPRSYYRCTHQKAQGCRATKQVQRSDEDPLLFDITYRGNHTCKQTSLPTQTSKGKQEQNQDSLLEQRKRKHSEDWLQNFRVGLKVKTERQEPREPTPSAFSFPSMSLDNSYMGSFGSYLSPTTPESNYFSTCHMTNIGSCSNFQTSECDQFNEIISATTSASNSSVFDLDFALDSFDLDTNFPFNNPNFLN